MQDCRWEHVRRLMYSTLQARIHSQVSTYWRSQYGTHVGWLVDGSGWSADRGIILPPSESEGEGGKVAVHAGPGAMPNDWRPRLVAALSWRLEAVLGEGEEHSPSARRSRLEAPLINGLRQAKQCVYARLYYELKQSSQRGRS